MSKLYELASEIVYGGASFSETAENNQLTKEERVELRRIIKNKKECA